MNKLKEMDDLFIVKKIVFTKVYKEALSGKHAPRFCL